MRTFFFTTSKRFDAFVAGLKLDARRRAKLKSERGVAFAELAIVLPIYVAIIIGSFTVYHYIRVYQNVHQAADAAAAVLSDPKMEFIKNPTDVGTGNLQWQDVGSLPNRPVIDINLEQCREKATPELARECIQEAIAKKRLHALTWHGYKESNSISQLDNDSGVKELPFALFEKRQTLASGYNPVQMLPVIGIEQGCTEPYNETGAFINPGSQRRGYFFDTSDNCSHVKPIYTQSPVKADFDGDMKEDIVFFRPRGFGTTWGNKKGVSPDDIDFIVYSSGSSYSLVGGVSYFNLTSYNENGTTPAPIPCVADYDRDRISDYGVWEPATAKSRIAFSTGGYKVIGEGMLGTADPTGALGQVAIPGNYTTTTNMQLAVIATGGDASNRYRIQLSGLIAPDIQDIMAKQNEPNPQIISLPGENFTYDGGDPKFKPHRGMSAVPAFADYDDSGITSIGWLNFAGGNLAKQIAGKVPGPDETTMTGNNTGGAPMDVVMNPFDLAFDSAGNMYYTDAVNGAVYRVSKGASDIRGDFSSGSVYSVIPPPKLFPKDSDRADPNLDGAETLFPKENVWNIPQSTSPTNEEIGSDPLSAGNRKLERPRRIAVASDFDNAMYVADFGHSRILKIDGSSNGVTPASSSWTVVEDAQCGGSTCYPSAVAIVPAEINGKYYLAFSSGYDVYIITHSGTSGGPGGANTPTVSRIAGDGNVPTATGNYPNRNYFANGRTSICPVIDLKWDSTHQRLLAASSCSLSISSTTAGDKAKNSGGILQLKKPSSTYISTWTPTIFVGGFWQTPCAIPGKCAVRGSNAFQDAGAYQRKIDLSPSKVQDIDIINPVSLSLTSSGGVLFIDEWNEAPSNDTAKYPSGRTDQQHQQGIYLIETSRTDGSPVGITSVTNPFSYGSNTVPVEGANWRSPYLKGDDQSVHLNIKPFEAPIKNINFPAVASLAVFGGRLYAATPWLANANDDESMNVYFSSNHPYNVSSAQVGFIYKADLDLDGDGELDQNDNDIDGDGVQNTQDSLPNCSDVFGIGDKCRVQEKIGNPSQTFAQITGEKLTLGDKTVDYGEYFFFNSVSSCGSDTDCYKDDSVTGDSFPRGFTGAVARSEPWATLLNFGDDQDLSGSACNKNLESTGTNDPYALCATTSNGPIAAPLPIHAFVGKVPTPIGNLASFTGKQNYNSIYPSQKQDADTHLILYPTILSSSRPRENGIKPTRNGILDKTKTFRAFKSGALCSGDYKAGVFQDGSEGGEGFPLNSSDFTLDLSSYLKNYLYSGLSFYEDFSDTNGISEFHDNDSLSYMPNCTSAALSDEGFGIPGVEGVVLQLDHDLSPKKTNVSGNEGYWPNPWVVGDVKSVPENSRALVMIDVDGDGVKNPCFINLEVFDQSGKRKAFNSSGPLYIACTGLKPESLPKLSAVRALDIARDPFNTSKILSDLDITSPSPLGLSPVFFGYKDGKEGLPISNLSFDYGRNATNPESIFVSLDFEPIVSASYTVKGTENVGSSFYSNYTKHNRFTYSEDHPAVAAAKNSLAISFGLQEQQKKDIIVSFCGKNNDGVDDCTGTCATDDSCSEVEVAYKTKIFAQDALVEARSAIHLPDEYRQKCDPTNLDPDGHPCPS